MWSQTLKMAVPMLFAMPLAGCPLLGGSGGSTSVELPGAELREVNLTVRPTNRMLAAYYCVEFVGGNVLTDSLCAGAFGQPPAKAELLFGFELIFDMENPNSFPIPMVELLLGLSVFEGEEASTLGAICVSFCDPAEEDCTQRGEDACRPPDKDINSVEDFVPTVDDLIRIAVGAATGTLDDNLRFRVIPAANEDGTPGIAEARVRFDLGVEAILGILEVVAGDSVSDLTDGKTPSFDIPYDVSGNLFFDVPVIGRLAVGYGPLEGTWSLD